MRPQRKPVGMIDQFLRLTPHTVSNGGRDASVFTSFDQQNTHIPALRIGHCTFRFVKADKLLAILYSLDRR